MRFVRVAHADPEWYLPCKEVSGGRRLEAHGPTGLQLNTVAKQKNPNSWTLKPQNLLELCGAGLDMKFWSSALKANLQWDLATIGLHIKVALLMITHKPNQGTDA